jgi:uncharacterized membrane protein
MRNLYATILAQACSSSKLTLTFNNHGATIKMWILLIFSSIGAKGMSEEFATPDEVTSDDKLWGLLSWIFTPLVPIIVLLLEDKKVRPFIKYNAMQALVFGVVSWVISGILSAVVIGCFIWLALLIYQIYLGIKAYNGEWVTIPFLTDFCKGQNWI